MKNFDYVKPGTEAEALRAAQARGAGASGAAGTAGAAATARYLAGGTNLVDLLRIDVEQPDLLIDLNALPYNSIDVGSDGLRIGALVKNSDLAVHPAVLSGFPVLSQALLSGASAQLRNMASVGGNLLQRPRCAYFRDVQVKACNKREPGSGCSAIDGYSRMHAVLGVSAQCIAANPSDMNVALLALDAMVHTRGARGERHIPIADFHTLPGNQPHIESVLERGELVTHVTIANSAWARRSAYVKARDRASFAFALASAAVALDLDGENIRQARVALGGVSHKPWRALEVERALLGKPARRETFAAASELAMREAKTTRDNHFKVALTPRLIVRALEQARGNT